MSKILSPTEYKKKKNLESEYKINFESFKKERKKKLGFYLIVCAFIFVLPNFFKTDLGSTSWSLSFLIVFIVPLHLILLLPALIQYMRGDIDLLNWLWYSLGLMVIGIGFIILLFFLPNEKLLESKFKENIYNKKS